MDPHASNSDDVFRPEALSYAARRSRDGEVLRSSIRALDRGLRWASVGLVAATAALSLIPVKYELRGVAIRQGAHVGLAAFSGTVLRSLRAGEAVWVDGFAGPQPSRIERVWPNPVHQRDLPPRLSVATSGKAWVGTVAVAEVSLVPGALEHDAPVHVDVGQDPLLVALVPELGAVAASVRGR